jgi:hypothetical protein
MRKILPLLLILPLFLSNCKKEDPILFEMVYAEDFVIQAGLNPFDTHYFRLKDIQVGTYLSSRNLTADIMNAINPKAANFINVFAGTAEYDFIRDISIRIYTDDENDYKEIFFYDIVPQNTGDNLGIIPSLVDAKSFLNEPTFNILIRLNLRRSPLQNIETQLRFSFGVK